MYLEYFGLQEQPFRLTPDSRFLYLSEVHAQAKAYMEYTIWNRDSFVIITGEIGSGKTTLIQKVLEELDDNVIVAKIHQTQLAEVQFLQALLAEFGIEAYKARKVQLLNILNNFLEEQNRKGRRIVLVVDEAQNLSPRVLEEIRLLSGLETDREASLNVILCGQDAGFARDGATGAARAAAFPPGRAQRAGDGRLHPAPVAHGRPRAGPGTHTGHAAGAHLRVHERHTATGQHPVRHGADLRVRRGARLRDAAGAGRGHRGAALEHLRRAHGEAGAAG